MIKYHYLEELPIHNKKVSNNLEIVNGTPFTGIKLYKDDEGDLYKTYYNKGIRNGISSVEGKNYYGVYLYFNDSLRFMFTRRLINTEKGEEDLITITYYYDSLEIENTVVKNGKNIINESIGINTNFNVEELLKANKDVLGDIQLYEISNTSELETFIWSSYNKEDQNSLQEACRLGKTGLAYFLKKDMEEGNYNKEFDLIPFYTLQNGLNKRVIKKDELKDSIEYLAGVDIVYNELEQTITGVIVVMEVNTFQVVDESFYKMHINFPYLPDLFSFRDVPVILEAYKKLKVIPDLIICNSQGIAHPKALGLATHLGIELNLPTIGCTEKRLVEYYKKRKLGEKRGDKQSLIWNDDKVGYALITKDNTKPMFVSIGYKISLKTAVDWVLKLTSKDRLPETAKNVNKLIDKILKGVININFNTNQD